MDGTIYRSLSAPLYRSPTQVKYYIHMLITFICVTSISGIWEAIGYDLLDSAFIEHNACQELDKRSTFGKGTVCRGVTDTCMYIRCYLG